MSIYVLKAHYCTHIPEEARIKINEILDVITEAVKDKGYSVEFMGHAYSILLANMIQMHIHGMKMKDEDAKMMIANTIIPDLLHQIEAIGDADYCGEMTQ